MDEQKQREIASKGGKAAHAKGTAHELDSEEAREAGRKGGEAYHGGRVAAFLHLHPVEAHPASMRSQAATRMPRLT